MSRTLGVQDNQRRRHHPGGAPDNQRHGRRVLLLRVSTGDPIEERIRERAHLSDHASSTSLASNYNSSLSLYNETFSLLVGAIAVVNTSLPIYQQASNELSQLWSRYLSLKPASSSLYAADILIDFGNGTRLWYNDTKVQPGWNMYTETVVLSRGDLQAQWYPDVSGAPGVGDRRRLELPDACPGSSGPTTRLPRGRPPSSVPTRRPSTTGRCSLGHTAVNRPPPLLSALPNGV